jgi:hypothetical protein
MLAEEKLEERTLVLTPQGSRRRKPETADRLVVKLLRALGGCLGVKRR